MRPPTVTATYNETQVLSISVSPNSATIGTEQQFTATVSGSGSYNKSVTWAVSALNSGLSPGSISSTGLYITPFPAPATVQVTATSVAAEAEAVADDAVFGDERMADSIGFDEWAGLRKFGEGVGGMLEGVAGKGTERFDFAHGGEPAADGAARSRRQASTAKASWGGPEDDGFCDADEDVVGGIQVVGEAAEAGHALRGRTAGGVQRLAERGEQGEWKVSCSRRTRVWESSFSSWAASSTAATTGAVRLRKR